MSLWRSRNGRRAWEVGGVRPGPGFFLSDLGQALLFLACYDDITLLSADRCSLYIVNSPSYHPSLGNSAPWGWGA